jgi:pimeloyl-ACP methyl ester carboxylesterase
MSVKIRSYHLGTIPVLEYSPASPKRLVFFQHGLYGSKEKVMQLMGVKVAQCGYRVVAIDSVHHGARAIAPFDKVNTPHGELRMFDLIDPSVEDVLAVYEKEYQHDYPDFDYIGISFGGLMGYRLITQSKRVRHLMVLMSTPDYEAFYQHLHPSLQKRYQDLISEGKKRIQAINPMQDVHNMQFKQLSIFHGTRDQDIPFEPSRRLVEAQPHANIKTQLFETGHVINKAMFEALIQTLQDTMT